jgi:hypothetical protein
MKTNTFADGHLPSAGRGTGRRAAAWLLGLTFAAAVLLSPAALFAEVLDDFSDPVKSEQIWTGGVAFGTGDQLVTNGQVRISVTPFGDHGFSGLNSVRAFTLREGRTLEFRADLVSSSGDGAVARLGFFFTDVEAGYVFNLDQDTISLLKDENPFQLFLLTNGVPIDVTNVKLVVSMTGVQSNVLVQLKILDNERPGRVVYATDVWDTPNRDPMQVGTDDPPGNFLGRAGKFFLGVYHDNVGWLDPDVEIPHLGEAEVVFDNAEFFEYDSAWIAGPQTVACLACWSQDTAEEQIVVGASSLASDAVWTPWPEPIFKRHGELCMAVPTTATQQFFKLVPGTQFIDDFSDPQEPFAVRNPWVPGSTHPQMPPVGPSPRPTACCGFKLWCHPLTPPVASSSSRPGPMCRSGISGCSGHSELRYDTPGRRDRSWGARRGGSRSLARSQQRLHRIRISEFDAE